MGLSSRFVVAVAALSTGLFGCGPTASDEEPQGFLLLQPKLDLIAPSALTLGDTVKVIGSDFIDAKDGELALLLDGHFIDADGVSHEFVGELQLEVINASVAEFSFEEIFFHPTGDKLGTWTGVAALVNRATAGDELSGESESWSVDKEISLRVEPSVMVSRLRTADDLSCALVTSATTSNQNLELGFKALGLGEATPERPWKVKMTYVAPEVEVRYVVPDAFDFWPIDGPLNDNVSTIAGAGTHSVTFDVDSGDNVIIDPTRTARVVRVSPPVTIGQKLYDEVVLGTLLASTIEDSGKRTVTFVIEITTSDGRTLRRLIPIDIWSEVEIGIWSGAEQVMERYEAHAVSGCIPGGEIGRDLTYSEGETVTRERELKVRWDAQVASTLGFSVGISATAVSSNQSWTQSFGIDVNESISSASHTSQNIKALLLPSYYGMSYRQLERLERSVDVIYHNACGQSGIVGEAQLTNWNFAFDVAQAKVCPPPTNLPPAEVF